ncbi:MAG TPA: hypothetical protein DDZ40_05470 [Deltaproteobacteria bacterium]|nr:hypothetical protein [Deltaproteobacteria bacterium]
MLEALGYLARITAKYGIIIFGLAWFLAIGSWKLFDGKKLDDRDRERLYWGIRILVVGLILLIVPF